MEIKDILASSASICTVLQYLAGVLVCRQYIKNGTTGDSSALSFVTCLMSCYLWWTYGMLIKDFFIVYVNLFGALLQVYNIIIFLIYSIKKSTTVRQVAAALVFILVIFIYSAFLQQDKTVLVKQVGFLSCTLTVLFFASPLFLLAHVIKVRSTESLPFPVIMASMIVSCQWFAYGCLINDHFIQVPNFMGCVLSGFQLSLFLIYPNKQSVEAYFI
ncbi:RAG1-activating protein 1-like protein [Harpegnathos saltator]|uniref:Sugar transporter SWEET1 n=2 Tax=Harpegnathos saltator TaxID=610380 RepID=E2BNB8_HARSA|nr:RAG1-activating protein 1-like protein [Harpegnathos saltator]